ncbi:hypothetical protein B0T16DRAFT_421113 [Cercophora newfieldiana]|uniref:Uncharacterized protein n=1 Tax=Cercophora newfieldiana TaxID=92897 RepID=A0AA39XZ12_9PEZI|nr:hypothetical protein B0T16DRAFT_421113 [Cercophora newfieldiana]
MADRSTVHRNATMAAQHDVFGAVSSPDVFRNDEASTNEALKLEKEAEKAAEEKRRLEREAEEVRVLRERMPTLEAQKAALEARLATFEAEKVRLDNEVSALKIAKAAVETEKTNIDNERSRLDGERAQLSTQVVNLECTNTNIQASYTSVSNELNLLKFYSTFEPRNNLDPLFHDRDVCICQASAPHTSITFEDFVFDFRGVVTIYKRIPAPRGATFNLDDPWQVLRLRKVDDPKSPKAPWTVSYLAEDRYMTCEGGAVNAVQGRRWDEVGKRSQEWYIGRSNGISGFIFENAASGTVLHLADIEPGPVQVHNIAHWQRDTNGTDSRQVWWLTMR